MLDSVEKALVVGAVVLGGALGSYGIAAAASGSSSSSTAGTTQAVAPSQTSPGATSTSPWGGRRSDEMPLSGDAYDRVKAAALAKAGSDATIIRIETDADGHAAYEAHLVTAAGTPETVYVDRSYDVVGVEAR